MSVPVISLPSRVTEATFLDWTSCRNCENEISSSLFCSVVEKFQIRTPTTTRTIQKSKLLRVEFNLRLLTAVLSRVSRHSGSPGLPLPAPPEQRPNVPVYRLQPMTEADPVPVRPAG